MSNGFIFVGRISAALTPTRVACQKNVRRTDIDRFLIRVQQTNSDCVTHLILG